MRIERAVIPALLISVALATGSLAGCTGTSETPEGSAQMESSAITTASGYENGLLDTSDMFSERDLAQTADLTDATYITVESGQDIVISEEGVFVLSGSAENVTISVDTEDSAKVQLVLDGLNITNDDSAAIYVVSADKVFITTTEGSTNELTVTGSFASDSEDDVDGVIFAKDDITLNGLGELIIQSSDNGIVGKDDVKVTGGSYQITASNHAIQGKDSVRIADGSFQLNATKDGIHAENSDDDSLGYVYICGGAFTIDAGSDGIEGDAVVQIDEGSISIEAAEGIEGTAVQLNGGTVEIQASDDGINATSKSGSYSPTIEINGGNISISMAAGDTDALDSNGSLIINGGTIDITAQFPFDYDSDGQLNGGTVIVNGEQVTELYNQMMGDMGFGMMGDMGDMDGVMAPMGDGGSMPGQGMLQ